jgi:peptidoglycan/xylan/chitin deacetylase (PgdA/CDA1 family)
MSVTACLHYFRLKLNRTAHRYLPLAMLAVMLAPAAAAAGSGVVVMYHRIGDEAEFPSTSVSKERFEAHISLLEQQKYTVWPLEKLAMALKSGDSIPDRTVAITFDDAYRSIYDIAWPRLKRAGMPFTIFVATKSVDSGSSRFLSWAQLREMTTDGVTIGNHTWTHLHMAGASIDRNREEIRHARRRLSEELSVDPPLFAYPFGEMSSAVRDLVIAEGFKAAFGQHSGVAHSSGDAYFIPRFAFNEQFGDLARFRRAVDAMPLPVADITPADPLIATNPPAFGFSVGTDMRGLHQLACYHSQFGKVDLMRLGEWRIEIRFAEPFRKGHTRLNCTLPGPDGRWRWFGRQFYVKPN